jgi:hypothetical protein
MMKRIKLLLFLLIFSCSAQAQTPAWVTDWFDHINTTMINGPANGGTKLYVGGLFDTVIAKIWQQTKNKINTTDTAAMLAGYINWLTFLDSLRDHWSAIQNISLTPGPAGADGSPGSDGVNGADGATWITGTGSPVGFGVNSDLYLDVSNGDVYKKTSGSWGLLTNIMGPVGPTGSGHFFADSIKLAHDTLAAHNTRLKNIEQAGYITGYTEIDPVANAKTVTMGSGYGLTGGGAAQALSANPSRTLLLDSGTVYPAVVSTLGAGRHICFRAHYYQYFSRSDGKPNGWLRNNAKRHVSCIYYHRGHGYDICKGIKYTWVGVWYYLYGQNDKSRYRNYISCRNRHVSCRQWCDYIGAHYISNWNGGDGYIRKQWQPIACVYFIGNHFYNHTRNKLYIEQCRCLYGAL